MPGANHLDYGDTMRTQAEALAVLTRAWPTIVEECRRVWGSELHYQAVLYHCLRKVGRVPPEQLGMNVKMWISDVVSDHFKAKDLEGFEPIPDIVIFRPDINGDFRRRNYSNTLRQMLLAIEIKVSELHKDRLTSGTVVKDILKLDALRTEARHRETGVLPAVIVVDTAPNAAERMRREAVHDARSVAEEKSVCFFYLSRDEELHAVPATL